MHKRSFPPSRHALARAWAGTLLALSLAALAACGGSGSSSSPRPASALSTAVWDGTITYSDGTKADVIGVTRTDGTCRMVFENSLTSSSGTLAVNNGNLTAANGFTVFAATDPNGPGLPADNSALGSPSTLTSSTLTAKLAGGSLTGTVSLDLETDLPALTLPGMNGNYQNVIGEISSGLTTYLVVSVDPTGTFLTFTGSDGKGTLSGGTFKRVGNTNVADAAFTYTSNAPGSTPQQFTGTAVLSPAGPGKDRLILLAADNGSIGYAGVFK
jgi:hypothetical protein